MKKIFLILSIVFLSSCEKEEEYITFTILNNGFNFTTDSLVVDYSVIAPGRVNIEDHGVEYISPGIDSGRVSFGSLKQAGVFHGVVSGLTMSNSYNFKLYAVSDGKRIHTKEYSGSTTKSPIKVHF